MSSGGSVGFLGLGTMGGPMAVNLSRAGLTVRGWNRTPGRAAAAAAHGVEEAPTAADAVAGADTVVTMLADGPAVEDVMVDGGVLAAMEAGSLWVQMSTVGATEILDFEQVAQQHDVALVDAPVLGTKQPAEDGQLVVLAAGPQEPRAQEVFDAVGGRCLWLADVGEATRLKLVLNSWVLNVVGAISETVSLAKAADVSVDHVMEALKGTGVWAPYVGTKGQAMAAGRYPTSFPLRLGIKDAGLVTDLAATQSRELPLLEVFLSLLEAARDQGWGEHDIAAAHEAWGDAHQH